MRVLELFSGLGGWRAALGDRGEVVAAYDISPAANATYALNHGARPLVRELATVPAEQLLAHDADAWFMSPPCQPFCSMGHRQDLEDRRPRALLGLMEIFRKAPPRHLVLENVEGFLGSGAHTLLCERIAEAGLRRLDLRLCPTAFGIPNQRPRVFIVASREALAARVPPALPPGPLAAFLDAEEDTAPYLDAATLAKHGPGLDLVRPEDRRSTCFIGGYGQRFVASGSFLQTERGVRRFSPGEIGRLMGLPAGFRFPPEVLLEQRYKLLGNGLSIPVARWVLGCLEAPGDPG